MGAPPRTVGRGVPCPAKMIKTAGKLRGKIRARFSNFPIEEAIDGTILQNLSMPTSACLWDMRETPSNNESYSCGLLLRESEN